MYPGNESVVDIVFKKGNLMLLLYVFYLKEKLFFLFHQEHIRKKSFTFPLINTYLIALALTTLNIHYVKSVANAFC